MKSYACFTLLTSFVFFLPSLFADKVEPAKDAVVYNGNHYKAFLDTNSTWWEAKFACDDIGGELVVINDAKENEFIRKLAKENLIWLGGTDEFEEGVWTWDNGEAFTFKNWDDNQPSATSGYNFLILDGKKGKWSDTTDFSAKVKGYICEWKGTASKKKTK
ncbi:MAG: lectin-like protein [Opitutales bacterium]|nr:lectin-like protein [Opitutales bacterium]